MHIDKAETELQSERMAAIARLPSRPNWKQAPPQQAELEARGCKESQLKRPWRAPANAYTA